jgi:hypothetical protein
VYLSDLQVLEIWDFGSTARSTVGRPSRAEPSQANNVGSHQKHPKPCGYRECEAVYLGIEAIMDSFATVPMTS